MVLLIQTDTTVESLKSLSRGNVGLNKFLIHGSTCLMFGRILTALLNFPGWRCWDRWRRVTAAHMMIPLMETDILVIDFSEKWLRGLPQNLNFLNALVLN